MDGWMICQVCQGRLLGIVLTTDEDDAKGIYKRSLAASDSYQTTVSRVKLSANFTVLNSGVEPGWAAGVVAGKVD